MANLRERSASIQEFTQVEGPESSETQSKSGGNMDSKKTVKLQENPEEEALIKNKNKNPEEEARCIMDSINLMCKDHIVTKPHIACPNVLPNDSSLHHPRIVSIGPHFRDLPNTRFVEDAKVTEIKKLFYGHSEALLECIKCIQIEEKEARGYFESNIIFSKEEFIKILFLDTIFLIRIIIDDEKRNSFFRTFPHVFLDLILTENQIPLFIIRKVWGVLVSRGLIKSENTLERGLKRSPFWKEGLSHDIWWGWNGSTTLAQLYYEWNVPIPERASTRRNPPLLQPLIDYSPPVSKSRIGSVAQTSDKRITSAMPPATELYEAGIEFKAKTTFQNMFDISFKNGMIEIPTMLIDSTNMSLIVNLLSFEKELDDDINNVASYVFFMDSLINTKNDVALLQKFGVVNNKLASDDAAAAFINSIGESCGIATFNSNNFYAPVIEDIMEYTASSWRRNWTSLKQTYFSNPWTGISVFAGSFLLILSCVQTYYTIFPKGH